MTSLFNQDWNPRPRQNPRLAGFLIPALVVSGVGSTTQFALYFAELAPLSWLIAIATICVGCAILFAWAGSSLVTRPESDEATRGFAVSLMSLIATMAFGIALQSAKIERQDAALFVLGFQVVTTAFLGRSFAKLHGYDVSIINLAIPCVAIAIVSGCMIPLLMSVVRENFSGKPELVDSIALSLISNGYLVVAGFMMWYAIKCGDADAAEF